MAYKKNTWKKGDKITPELLNNIENGIEEAHRLLEKLFETVEPKVHKPEPMVVDEPKQEEKPKTAKK